MSVENVDQLFYFVHYNIAKDGVILKDKVLGPYDSFHKAEIIALAAPMAFEWGEYTRINKWMWINESYSNTIGIYVRHMNENYEYITVRAIKNQTKSLE